MNIAVLAGIVNMAEPSSSTSTSPKIRFTSQGPSIPIVPNKPPCRNGLKSYEPIRSFFTVPLGIPFNPSP